MTTTRIDTYCEKPHSHRHWYQFQDELIKGAGWKLVFPVRVCHRLFQTGPMWNKARALRRNCVIIRSGKFIGHRLKCRQTAFWQPTCLWRNGDHRAILILAVVSVFTGCSAHYMIDVPYLLNALLNLLPMRHRPGDRFPEALWRFCVKRDESGSTSFIAQKAFNMLLTLG